MAPGLSEHTTDLTHDCAQVVKCEAVARGRGLGLTSHLGVRPPPVEPPSEAFAVELGALRGTEVHAAVGTFLAVAQLQRARGALTKPPSTRRAATQVLQLGTSRFSGYSPRP